MHVLREARRTLFTGVRLLAKVQSVVCLQVGLGAKLFAALVTGVGLLA